MRKLGTCARVVQRGGKTSIVLFTVLHRNARLLNLHVDPLSSELNHPNTDCARMTSNNPIDLDISVRLMPYLAIQNNLQHLQIIEV